MSKPTVNDMMIAYAQDAVDFAQLKFGITLDYSNESIKDIENIAQILFEQLPKGFLAKIFKKGPSENYVHTMCKMLGGYIGEVYLKNKSGEWAINEQYQAIAIRCGDSWIFPPAKVYKRLTNGSEDNLWHYFFILINEE